MHTPEKTPTASASALRRLAWLLACVGAGVVVGFAGSTVTGNDYWYLAIPAAMAAGWLFFANPAACEPGKCADRELAPDPDEAPPAGNPNEAPPANPDDAPPIDPDEAPPIGDPNEAPPADPDDAPPIGDPNEAPPADPDDAPPAPWPFKDRQRQRTP